MLADRISRVVGCFRETALPAGYVHRSIYDLVLAEGREFESSPPTDGDRAVLRNVLDGLRPGDFPMKSCFENAYRISARACLGAAPVRYCEGYGTTGRILAHHSWLTVGGKVFDPTWSGPNSVGRRWADRVFGAFPEGFAYFGVEFTADQFAAAVATTRMRGGFFDDWQSGHRFVRLGFRGALEAR